MAARGTSGARAPLVGDLLRDAARDHPDREALVHGPKRVTYAWLDRAADGFAATLLGLGVAKGDVVCLMLPSSIKFVACYLGALRAGAVTSAINLRLGPAEQASIVERTAPAVTVLGDGAAPPAGAPLGTALPVDELGTAFSSAPPAPDTLPELSPADPTCVVWTSGTTGAPKGAVYDHAAQDAISRNMGPLTVSGERRLLVVPFAHVGFMTRVADELRHGTTIVCNTEPWSAVEHVRLLDDERITMATGVPTQWSLVLERPELERVDGGSLRIVATGGAPVPPQLVRRLRSRFGCPVVTRYTSTEAGLATGTDPDDPDDVVATTVGRPAPEVELRVVDPGGATRPAGEVGEILLRSPAMMRGYWRDPDHTAEAIRADGFLRTGDLGRLDADGNLHLAGRRREMYVRGGYNVYPVEVEHVLADHPAVARVAVVGVDAPVLGQIGAAFVVPAPGIPSGGPSLDELRAWCRSRIADYKAPDRLVLLDELPLNGTGKVDKLALARRQEVR